MNMNECQLSIERHYSYKLSFSLLSKLMLSIHLCKLEVALHYVSYHKIYTLIINVDCIIVGLKRTY